MIILRQKHFFGLDTAMNTLTVGSAIMGTKSAHDQSKQSAQDFQAQTQKNNQMIKDLNTIANRKPVPTPKAPVQGIGAKNSAPSPVSPY